MQKPIIRDLKLNNKPKWPLFAAGILFCILLAGVSLILGAAQLPLSDVLHWMVGGEIGETAENILLYIRLPRILAAFFCGMGLALAGLLLQASLNNVLASPGIIGVNAGAGFFVVAISAVFPAAYILKMPAAFLGAVITAFSVYGIARKTGSSKTAIVMTGIAISSLMSAGIDLIVTIRPDSVLDRMAFYIGGFSGVRLDAVFYLMPPIVICVIAALFLAPGLNVLQLGDDSAVALGLHVHLYRGLTILCAAILAGSAVAVCGLLGFVGLIVPHIVRYLVGMDYRLLIPYTALFGGAFLLACDTLSRLLLSPFELPVGILLSAAGAPFFLYLILSKRRRLSL